MSRVLSDFAGRWAIVRDITHVGQSAAQFTGQATFAAAVDGCDYHEVGTLHIQGVAPMHSERRYRWDASLNVYFDDGRFFHTVPAQGGNAQHWCDPDQYDVHYQFDDWPDWTATWRVRGLRKDYTMVTRFRKA